MKIIYFHGFGSSGASGTVELLRSIFPSAEVIAPDIPIDPADALPYLKQLCEDEQPDLIIGTSMGGMYAQQMRGFRRFCVNPAFRMSSMSKVFRTGTFKFFNRRKDNQKEFRITKDIIQHQMMMERKQFEGITDFDIENCYGFFGINDPNGSTYDMFCKHYKHAIKFEGEHQLNEKVIKKVLIPVIREILPEAYNQAIEPPKPDYMRY